MLTRDPSPSEIAGFQRAGYAVLEDQVDSAVCARIRQDIDAFRETGRLIDTSTRTVLGTQRFHTFNGDELSAAVSDADALYESLGQLGRTLSGQSYVPVSDRKVGLSINVTPPGGHFSYHYDRNALTILVYLNEVEGGQMEIYPRYRRLLPGWRDGLRRYVQIGKDLAFWPAPMRAVFGKKVTVTPRPGMVVVFEGSRSLHRVRAVRDGVRYSMQLAYDHPGVTYQSAYYGYA